MAWIIFLKGYTMKSVKKQFLDNFIHSCHRIANYNLIQCSSGNLSLRIDTKRMLVTSSKSWMESMSEDKVSVCRVADGKLLSGGQPTREIGFHLGIMQKRYDVNAILHFQSPFATTLSCQESETINYFVIPEVPFYIGAIKKVPYFLPGSKQLSKVVTDAMQDYDMVVIENHGQVTVARNLEQVIQNAVFFEFASKIIIQGGEKAKPISKREVNKLLSLRKSKNGGV